MLIEIKQYLIEKNYVSLDEIANHFNISLDFMQEMLNYWEKKGCVESIKIPIYSKKHCKHCTCCLKQDLSQTCTVYHWIKAS